MGGTVSAFMRRLHAASDRLGHWCTRASRTGSTARRASVTVVAIQSLHEQAQRFVVGALLNETFQEKEESGQRLPLSVIVLDELNKYAPREGTGPLKDMLIDIAQRGRSLGVLLVGAQQTASRVAPEVLENAAIRVAGRLDAAEAERSEYGWMLPSTRARARLLKPGTMVMSQPSIPVPLVVTFPFPPWATRKEEADAPTAATRSRVAVAPSAAHADPPHVRLAHRQAPRPLRPDGRVRGRPRRGRAHRRRPRRRPGRSSRATCGTAPSPRWTRSTIGLRLAAAARANAARSSPSRATTTPPSCSRRSPRCCARAACSWWATSSGRTTARSWVPRSWASPPSWPCFPFLREGTGRRLHAGGRRRGTAPTPSAWRRSPPRTTRPWWRAPAPDAVPILMAHFLVSGVKLDRAAPRGERELHMGDAYAATAQAIPAGPAVRGDGSHPRAAARPGRAGAGRVRRARCSPWTSARRASTKRVVVVDVRAGPARRRSRACRSAGGRPLRARHGDVGRDRGARAPSWRTRSSTSRCARRRRTRRSPSARARRSRTW